MVDDLLYVECNIPDWIALVNGNIQYLNVKYDIALKIKMNHFPFTVYKTTLIIMLVFTNILKDIGTIMVKFTAKMMSASCCQQYCSHFWMVLRINLRLSH